MKVRIETKRLHAPVRRIGIVSPASRPLDGKIEPAASLLRKEGFEVHLSDQVYADGKWTAGSDEDRISALQTFLLDDLIDCIWASRGGYGTPRIADKIRCRAKNKLVLGYSDITYLLISFLRLHGVSSVHAPVVSDICNPEKLESIQTTISYLKGEDISSAITAVYQKHFGILRGGETSGELVGGNLIAIQNLIGTSNLRQLKGKLLFLEEVGEKMYSLDRVLQHLGRAGVYSLVKGIVLGGIYRPEEPSGFTDDDLHEAVLEATHSWNLPVFFGLPVGHGTVNLPIPYGSKMSVTK